MGIHVKCTGRGAAKERYFLHPGEKVRPRPRPAGASSRSGKALQTAKKDGPTGTRGDFGSDFE